MGEPLTTLITVMSSLVLGVAVGICAGRLRTGRHRRWFVTAGMALLALMTLWAAHTTNFPATFGPFVFVFLPFAARRPRSSGPAPGSEVSGNVVPPKADS